MMKPRKQFHIDFLVDHIPMGVEIGVDNNLYHHLGYSSSPSPEYDDSETLISREIPASHEMWRLTYDACWEGGFLYFYLEDPAI